MKEIQPISIWYNGQIVQATQLWLNSISDNLSTNASFNYWLTDNNQIRLTQGFLLMEGADYTTYSTSPDSNAYAYSWGATQLNLTLV